MPTTRTVEEEEYKVCPYYIEYHTVNTLIMTLFITVKSFTMSVVIAQIYQFSFNLSSTEIQLNNVKLFGDTVVVKSCKDCISKFNPAIFTPKLHINCPKIQTIESILLPSEVYQMKWMNCYVV